MELFAFIALPIGAMVISYWQKNLLFAVMAIAGWLILAAFAYTEAVGVDAYYGLFIFSIGMVIASAVEMFMFRGKKDPVFSDPDEKDDEYGIEGQGEDPDAEAIARHRRIRDKKRRPPMSAERRTQIQMRAEDKRTDRRNEGIQRGQRR